MHGLDDVDHGPTLAQPEIRKVLTKLNFYRTACQVCALYMSSGAGAPGTVTNSASSVIGPDRCRHGRGGGGSLRATLRRPGDGEQHGGRLADLSHGGRALGEETRENLGAFEAVRCPSFAIDSRQCRGGGGHTRPRLGGRRLCCPGWTSTRRIGGGAPPWRFQALHQRRLPVQRLRISI